MLKAAIVLAAKKAGLTPWFLLAICSAETDLRNVINPNDPELPSYGVCQLKLGTARMFDKAATACSLMDPEVNAALAAQYLRKQYRRYPGNLSCAIAAYNAGRCKKDKNGNIMNQDHVNKVMERYVEYKKIYSK